MSTIQPGLFPAVVIIKTLWQRITSTHWRWTLLGAVGAVLILTHTTVGANHERPRSTERLRNNATDFTSINWRSQTEPAPHHQTGMDEFEGLRFSIGRCQRADEPHRTHYKKYGIYKARHRSIVCGCDNLSPFE